MAERLFCNRITYSKEPIHCSRVHQETTQLEEGLSEEETYTKFSLGTFNDYVENTRWVDVQKQSLGRIHI